MYLLGIEQGVVCRFEAVHANQRPGMSLVGGRDFDGVSVHIWPRVLLVGSGYTDRRSRRQLLVLGVAALLNSEDPRVRLIGHFRQNQQVVAAEGLGRLPLLTVLVEARKGDGVAGAPFGIIGPDGSLDGADADFREGFGGLPLTLNRRQPPGPAAGGIAKPPQGTGWKSGPSKKGVTDALAACRTFGVSPLFSTTALFIPKL